MEKRAPKIRQMVVGVVLVTAAVAGYWLQNSGKLAFLTGQQLPLTQQAPQAGRPPAGGPSQVEVLTAETRKIGDNISTIGTLLAQEQADVAAETNGRIVAIGAADGDKVEVGQDLFTLDGELIAAQLRESQARLQLAQSNFDRNNTLRRSRNIAQSVFEQSEAELTQAKSALELVRVQESKLSIRAPFSGVLGFRKVSVGNYVTPGQALVTLAKIDELKVHLSVPERFFLALKTGGDVSLTADAVPDIMFKARITALNPVVDVNGRAVQIQASLNNRELKLRPGMLVRASILGPERAAVTVSEAAIVPQGQQIAVFKVEGDKVVRVPVKVGARRDGWVEVREGLHSGETVVTAGHARLRDGAQVQVNKQTVTQ